MKYITMIEKTFQGAYRIYGVNGVKQYFFYSKKDAIKLYNTECKKLLKKGV